MGVTQPGRHEQPTWPFGFRPVSAADAAAAIRPALVQQLPTIVVAAHALLPKTSPPWRFRVLSVDGHVAEGGFTSVVRSR